MKRRTLLLVTGLCITALSAACADGGSGEIPPPDLSSGEKKDGVSDLLTIIKGELDVGGDSVTGELEHPLQWDGYTFEVEQTPTDLVLSLSSGDSKGKFYVYGPAVYSDGGDMGFDDPLATIKTDGGEVETVALNVDSPGTYLVVTTSRRWSASYTIALSCSSGCPATEDPNDGALVADQLTGDAFFSLVDMEFNTGDGFEWDGYVLPELGIFGVTRPGAIDRMALYQGVEHFVMADAVHMHSELVQSGSEPGLSYGSLPDFNCDEGFSKEGHFVELFSTDGGILAHAEAIADAVGAPLSDEDRAAYTRFDDLTVAKAIFTDIGTGMTVYFTAIDGRFYIIGVDLVATSCGA